MNIAGVARADWGTVGPAFSAMATENGFTIRSVPDLQRLGGGFWAELWRADLDTSSGPRSVVLRRMPDRVLAVKEATVQRVLAESGFPAPAVRWFDASGDGPAQMVMDVAAGAPMLADLGGRRALLRLPGLGLAVPGVLASVAATLHRVPVDPIRVALAAVGNTAAVTLDEILDWLQISAAEAGRVDLTLAMEHLRSRRPELSDAVICHGDTHPLNVVTHGTDWSLIDWTACVVTDPAYDVAFTSLLLGNPPIGVPRALRLAVSVAGRTLASRFISTYNVSAPVPVTTDRLRWFRGLHALRILLELHWLHEPNPSGTPPPKHHPWLCMKAPAERALVQATSIPAA